MADEQFDVLIAHTGRRDASKTLTLLIALTDGPHEVIGVQRSFLGSDFSLDY